MTGEFLEDSQLIWRLLRIKLRTVIVLMTLLCILLAPVTERFERVSGQVASRAIAFFVSCLQEDVQIVLVSEIGNHGQFPAFDTVWYRRFGDYVTRARPSVDEMQHTVLCQESHFAPVRDERR